MANIVDSFFYILSCACNRVTVNWTRFKSFSPEDWEELYLLSKKQGVVAIVLERIKAIPKEYAPPKEVSIRWISHAISIEQQMKAKELAAVEYANALSSKNIPIVVLKGLSYATYFPNPHFRESGDLDCYLFGKKEEGDNTAVEMGGRKEDGGYKHSHLYYKGLMIENHRYLTNFDNSKLGIKTERLLQQLINAGCSPIRGTKLLKPCADFNAIFLIKHAQRHFIREGICIRHLLDWAFFLKEEASHVNWEYIIPLMNESRILNFAKVMTSICVEKFGVAVDVNGLNCHSAVSETVLSDVLSDKPNRCHEKFTQKIERIVRRLYRMYKFRSLADESYFRLLWNNIVFSSYVKRRPKL